MTADRLEQIKNTLRGGERAERHDLEMVCDELLTEVERLHRALLFAYERGYRNGVYGRPLATEEQTRDLRLGE